LTAGKRRIKMIRIEAREAVFVLRHGNFVLRDSADFFSFIPLMLLNK